MYCDSSTNPSFTAVKANKGPPDFPATSDLSPKLKASATPLTAAQ